MATELSNYQYGGARACVLLHEKHMRQCLEIWKQAKAANVKLPQTDDPSYESLEHLLYHILRAARGYMVWMCKQLELPDPDIRATPDIDKIEAEADSYLEHVLERWRLPLANVPEEKFEPQTYASNWGTHYCIDAMLEHAVMHPIRHDFQLRYLLNGQTRTNMSTDPEREFLRHTLATLAYRCGKTLREAPSGFAEFRSSETTRTPGNLLTHIGDLLDWALSLAKNEKKNFQSQPLPWSEEVARFYKLLADLDGYLASGAPLHAPVERLFQGPIADALTHTGQLALLRRMAGAPIRGENYFVADIVAGRVGSEQSKGIREWD